jgi:hypothetical protein
MRSVCLLCLHGLLVGSSAFCQTANHAGRVLDYHPGHDPGALTNATAVLGAPSRETADPQWGTYPVDPFFPPYLDSQLVALGSGGFLIVGLEHPVIDDPGNPHGIDFLVFGNALFQLNTDRTTTSGSLGGTNSGTTLVSVSPDGIAYYPLAPELAPSPDNWFPTDHTGASNLAVNPALTTEDFAGRDLEGIRQLYAGSAGGTGYDLAWARDEQGNPVQLPFVRYIRFDQQSGVAQFDAVSAVTPPPSIFSDFETDPAIEGWRAFGDPTLFQPDAGTLRVTWDSSKTNSYFYRPLGTTLNRQDDFALGFDLRLESVVGGVDPAKPFTFQIAMGLIELASATNTALWRAAGVDAVHGPRNLVEFAYFPDSGFGATIAPSIISSNNQFASQFDFPIELTVETTFNVLLRYTAHDQILRTSLRQKHTGFATIQDVVLAADFTDFTVDAVAICSYSDVGQDPRFGGSILAAGMVDNLFVQLPRPPVDELVGVPHAEGYEVTFSARGGWSYALERSTDLEEWTIAATHTPSTHGSVTLADTAPPVHQAFYRVRASR